MRITVGHTEVDLLPERAAFLPASKALVVADLHLGKSATFRTRGLPVPEGTTQSDLDRLSQLLDHTKASSLVIAGDLIHAHDGLTSSVLRRFKEWLGQIGCPVILTEGNHDRRSSLSRSLGGIQIVREQMIDKLLVTHDPEDLPASQVGLAGHLHPGIRISESRHSSIRLPAFQLRDEKHLIMPAFSEFTGLQIINPTPADRFFVSLRDSITEVPTKLIS